MMDFNDVKKYIKENHVEVTAILESNRLAILNSSEIKILHGKYLIDFWNNRRNKGILYLIHFPETEISKLSYENIKANLAGDVTETLKTHQIVGVNANFEVLSRNADAITEDRILELSNKENVVFYFGDKGIDVAVRGKLVLKLNIFYNESDRLKFLEKFHISSLQACIDQYAVYIREPGVNEAFFASRNLISRLQPVNPPTNTLHNKPERILRDNLLSYLNRNTQHTFSKENELNDKRELDLYTEVDGKQYLIEVKWLGQTVNDDETGFTQKVTDVSARSGVTQTLEYIKELIENMSFNVHCGYLCVFDVREIKTPINYQSYNFIRKDLLPYYQKHFIKLREIPLFRST